ncbi:MAG TPA: sigma-70 family RNA polymerase sigma factor [Polyangia bacterium]|nr:sigma-70 family RNA polymerase sigma factor [Polyangia bacterium]
MARAQRNVGKSPDADKNEEDSAESDGEDIAVDAGEAAPVEVVVEPPLPEGKGLTPYRDPVQRFLNEARSYPRLSEEQEKELIQAVRDQGDVTAARKLVVHNLRLVVSIAYQYRQAWINMLDLFQEGSVGLMEAVKRWDPALGTRFGSYAAYWIRAMILRFLMTNARLIHVGNTRAGRKLFFRLEKERQKLLAAGYEPTTKLLAAKLDVAEDDVIEVAGHLASREVSIEPRPDDESGGLAERISGKQASPEDEAARSELSDAVRALMDEFEKGLTDERERAVWREHLAAADDPLPLAVLGERFGVSKQRMGQIADKLKKRFKEEILSQLGQDIQLSWQQSRSAE